MLMKLLMRIQQNDALTITPGIAIIDVDAGETTLAAVKASFSF